MYPDVMELTSTAFENGQPIPRRHSCDGPDLSPPLSWSGVPEGSQALALICDDPDAPAGTWVHWVYFDIPASAGGLAEGVPADEKPATGGVQGRNDFRRIGYGGPCPPGGRHRYYFKLYALDAPLGLSPNSGKSEVESAIRGHVLADTQLMGTYSR